MSCCLWLIKRARSTAPADVGTAGRGCGAPGGRCPAATSSVLFGMHQTRAHVPPRGIAAADDDEIPLLRADSASPAGKSQAVRGAGCGAVNSHTPQA